MWYPQNGSIAIGSKRSSPTTPAAAAVFSEPMIEPMNTPCSQSNASVSSGTTVARRPPNRNASIGTPFGSSHSGAMDGHWSAGVVKRALGWAAGSPDSGFQSSPCQSVAWLGGLEVMPSHQMSPSSVRAQFVKMEFARIVSIAFGFVFRLVPGATPKNPASGLIAYSRPSSPNFIHAMSSPTVSTFQPGSVGISIARFVLPHADGKAPVTCLTVPSGEVSLRMSMCSASQPSSRAITEAIRRAKHFFPSRALPPYPEPNDQISRASGKCAMYFSSLQGHGTSPTPSTSGIPTECRQGTNSPSLPRTSSAPWPMRVMILMDTATYAESVSCTPTCAIGDPSGPMEKGTTYIVRPRIEPRNSSVSVSRISSGSRQLLVGPASCSLDQLAAEPVVLVRRAVAPVNFVRLRELRHLLDPGEQLLVSGGRGRCLGHVSRCLLFQRGGRSLTGGVHTLAHHAGRAALRGVGDDGQRGAPDHRRRRDPALAGADLGGRRPSRANPPEGGIDRPACPGDPHDGAARRRHRPH